MQEGQPPSPLPARAEPHPPTLRAGAALTAAPRHGPGRTETWQGQPQTGGGREKEPTLVQAARPQRASTLSQGRKAAAVTAHKHRPPGTRLCAGATAVDERRKKAQGGRRLQGPLLRSTAAPTALSTGGQHTAGLAAQHPAQALEGEVSGQKGPDLLPLQGPRCRQSARIRVILGWARGQGRVQARTGSWIQV